MYDEFNVLGICTLVVSFYIFFLIYKNKLIGSFISVGWLGLFVYSLPVYINYSRKIFYTGNEVSYLINPPLEAKFVYFLFWIGFLFSLFFIKKNDGLILAKKKVNQKIFNIFEIIFEINVTMYLIYYIFFEIQNSFLLLLGRWLLLFIVIIYAIREKFFKTFLIFIIITLYSFYVPDRTLIAISFFSVFSILVYRNKHKYFQKINFAYLVSFLSFGIIILFNKLIFNVFFGEQTLSLDNIFVTLYKLPKSFEPFIIFAHTTFSLNINNFDTIKYLESIFSNLFIFPSYFELNNNYYYETLIKNLPLELNYGIGSSIFASTYLGFGFSGLLLIGFLVGYTTISLDKYIKSSNSLHIILATAVAAFIATYIFRNSLDNFFSFIRQIIIVYVFLYFQFYIFINIKNRN